MRGNKLSIRLRATLAIFAVALVVTGSASAQETILHSVVGPDGGNPYANLVFDSAGNLYGTTAYGGAYGFGTAFQPAPRAAGGGKRYSTASTTTARTGMSLTAA